MEYQRSSYGGALVPDSPAPKRQKTETGYHNASRQSPHEYFSENDSGDDLFEGLGTLEDATYQTQPTQIINRDASPSSPSHPVSPVVLIPASSPFRPAQQERTKQPLKHNAAGQGGRLASSMAPAGTLFKLPNGVTHSSAKPVPIIDLSDDDGPQYMGSDDDGQSRSEIRRSLFLPRKEQGDSLNRAPSGSGSGSTSQSSFQDHIASFAFSKDNARTSVNSVRKGGAVPVQYNNRPMIQTKPERAMPVMASMRDIDIEDISDPILRRKVEKINAIVAGRFTLTMIRNAILAKKGDCDDATELLLSSTSINSREKPHEISDDEDDLAGHVAMQYKHKLSKPVDSILNRYSSTQQQKKIPASSAISVRSLAQKPKRKLMQGRRDPSSPAAPISVKGTKSIKVGDDDLESEDSGLGSESEDDPELEGRVLHFQKKGHVRYLFVVHNKKQATANLMLASRPFRNLEAARRVSDAKPSKAGKRSVKAPVGEKIVQTTLDVMQGYEAIDALVSRCKEIGKPLTEAMSKWGFDVFGAAKSGELDMVSFDDLNDSGIGTPSSKATSVNGEGLDEDVKSVSRKTRQVDFLKKPSNMADDLAMKDYQLIGLNWLALLYKHELSCILADDMGLGKTLQIISFLSHLATIGVSGPHLVIVPSSTLENWLREFEKFSPDLVVQPYYGSQAERRVVAEEVLEDRSRINVVVSTYDFAAKEEDNKFMRRLNPVVCIFDEGHVLKNPKSLRYKGLVKIQAKFRVLLTGTPLQNNLMELAALLGFILPALFKSRADDLEFIFKHKATTRDADHAALLSSQRISRAKSMLTPFVLRRKKDQVLKDMPPKTSRVEYCDLHPVQKAVYQGLEDKAVERARLRLAGVRVPNDGENNPLMQLRKSAIHAMLFRRHFNQGRLDKMLKKLLKHESDSFNTAPDKIMLEMQAFSDWVLHLWCTLYPSIREFDVPDLEWMKSGKVEVLVRLVKKYKENGDRVLIFSQFVTVLDILMEVLNTSEIRFMRIDGSTPVNERQTLIDDFRDDEDITAFLLSTGSGGTGINLMYANKVIIFDGSFNPQDDVQAENRAHRIGQKRPVEVVRIISRDTIEEQIYKLGQSKLALDSKVNGDEEPTGERMVEKMLLEAKEAKATKEEGVEAEEGAEASNGENIKEEKGEEVVA